MAVKTKKKKVLQPGTSSRAKIKPGSADEFYKGSGKLLNKIVLMTGGDSGIARSIPAFLAKEGADIAIVYLHNRDSARKIKSHVEELGRRCFLMEGDVTDEEFCQRCVKQTLNEFKKIDILINNTDERHTEQYVKRNFSEMTSEQFERTFRKNVFSYFYMIKSVLPYFKKGCNIINTTPVSTYLGNDQLIDYSAAKGAIINLTRSLARVLAEKNIRVNAVAPGPIWTSLIPSSFSAKRLEKFGKDVPMKRAGQPEEVAPSYVFLASDDASYMTGQILYPNGGEVINELGE